VQEALLHPTVCFHELRGGEVFAVPLDVGVHRALPPVADLQDRFDGRVPPGQRPAGRYAPDYLKDDPHLCTDDGARLLDLTKGCERSDLVIDGGNVVRWNDAVILTDRMYQENPNVQRPKVRHDLRRLLEIERLVVITKERGDAIGHSDDTVRLDRGGKEDLVNDHRKVKSVFCERLARSPHKHGSTAARSTGPGR
jgi:hypothetical protein